MDKNKSYKPFSLWPSYSEEESEAVKNVLLSNKVNYWTGNICRDFEKKFAEWIGVDHAVAVSNGTLALEIALRSLNLKSNSSNNQKPEIIVTSRTFLATVSSIISIGATPIFVDVDENSQNISIENIKNAVTENTAAIICVHLAGWPCDMDEIMELALAKNLFVVEDCAQAHGARYKNQMVGSFGHVAAWSFCQDKIMTTGGEGGMITTNNKKIWNFVWSFKDHGKSYNAVYTDLPKSGYRWLHESFGTNARMTEMQAAIGIIQLSKMYEWNIARANNAKHILEFCKQFPKLLRVPFPPSYINHAWYKCYVFIKPDGLKDGWTRDLVIDEINKLSIPCFSGTCSEVYLEKAFDEGSYRPKKRLDVAKQLGETSLMFLVHPNITELELKNTCSAIESAINLAQR